MGEEGAEKCGFVGTHAIGLGVGLGMGCGAWGLRGSVGLSAIVKLFFFLFFW